MTQEEIIICDLCNGRGYTKHEELIDYHKREYNITKQDCRKCKNSGRLVKTTTTTINPYQQDWP